MVIRIPFEQDALKQAYLTQVGAQFHFKKAKHQYSHLIVKKITRNIDSFY